MPFSPFTGLCVHTTILDMKYTNLAKRVSVFAQEHIPGIAVSQVPPTIAAADPEYVTVSGPLHPMHVVVVAEAF